MLTIRKASEAEFSAVRAFYHNTIELMQNAPHHPGWQKGVYPSDAALRAHLRTGELYIGLAQDEIAAAMVLNHACSERYADAHWPTQASPDEVFVLHLLGVLPTHARRGYAKRMVQFAIDLARQGGGKCLRLDVLHGNLPALRLYEGLGFRYVETLPLFYEDTGWTDFLLYEYAL